MKNLLFFMAFVLSVQYVIPVEATYRNRGYMGTCDDISQMHYDKVNMFAALDKIKSEKETCTNARISTESTFNVVLASTKEQTAWLTLVDEAKKERAVKCVRVINEYWGKYKYEDWSCSEKE